MIITAFVSTINIFKFNQPVIFLWLCSPAWDMLSSFTRFRDHTQHATVSRTPLDEWSAHRRDLYLTTHNRHNRQKSMLPVGFEPTIAGGKRPYTYAVRWDRLINKLGYRLAWHTIKSYQMCYLNLQALVQCLNEYGKWKISSPTLPVSELVWYFFAHCPSHPNLLVQKIGNYILADLSKLYKKYKLKRTKHILH
jgi:hypothetical protein